MFTVFKEALSSEQPSTFGGLTYLSWREQLSECTFVHVFRNHIEINKDINGWGNILK